MPTVEIDFMDFQSLLGVELPKNKEELDEILSYVKGEAKFIDENDICIELQDTNRIDLLCVEGLNRALQGFIGVDRGLKKYDIKGSSRIDVWVDPRLNDIRPYIACSVLRGIDLNDAGIRQIMRLQDKMDQTYGRQRRRTSIGLYDLDLVSPPISYVAAEPSKTSFVPLGFEQELTLEDILDKHPKGIEYGYIIRQYPLWPIFIDSKKKVLSFPPIINSNELGRITKNTKNILIEVTGTNYKIVLQILNVITLSLADRGGTINSTKIHYPHKNMEEIVTPQLKFETLDIDINYVNKIMGIKLDLTEIKDLLERSRYGVTKIKGSYLTVDIPCYRADIMHPIDVIEDIAIAFNYNKMTPRWPKLSTIGATSPETDFCDLAREIMIGLGFQEIQSLTLTNFDNLFTKMNLKPEKTVEIANPRITSLHCLRNWLLPSLMDFLRHNTHLEYPQRIFELGYCVVLEGNNENKTKDLVKIACATVHSNANFTEAKSILDSLLLTLGTAYEIVEMNHESFIDGRIGGILVENDNVGFIGEIHPQVLNNWKLENPVAVFEVDFNKLGQKQRTRYKVNQGQT